FCFAVLAATPVLATDGAVEVIDVNIAETDGPAERLDAADRLRTVTQELSSAACHYFNGVAPEKSRAMLIEAREDFNRLIDALEFGDESLGIIGKEHGSKQLKDLHAMRQIWAPMEAAVETLLEAQSDSAAVQVIKANNMELFDKADLLLALLTEEYANPAELILVDAMMIDIAGRASMLTQKIAKQSCEIWTGNRSEDRIEALQTSISQFQMSVAALHDGMPSLGILPAPTPEIKVALEEIMTDWAIVKEDLTAIIENVATEEIEKDLFGRMNAKMYKMDEVVHAYVEYSKHIY
ncbi:MAG: type IV pili methyl-accepting chemotaxis transducer N-terminal domain-containing protein, partial [Pseudomonadota bacterium]